MWVTENVVFDLEKPNYTHLLLYVDTFSLKPHHDPINVPPGFHFLRSHLYSYEVGGAIMNKSFLPQQSLLLAKPLEVLIPLYRRFQLSSFREFFPLCDRSVAQNTKIPTRLIGCCQSSFLRKHIEFTKERKIGHLISIMSQYLVNNPKDLRCLNRVDILISKTSTLSNINISQCLVTRRK